MSKAALRARSGGGEVERRRAKGAGRKAGAEAPRAEAGLAEYFPDKYDIYEVVLVCGNASLKRIRLKSREKQQ